MPNRVCLTRLLVLASLMGVVGLAPGCGGAAATGDLDKLQVTLSQLEVTVTSILQTPAGRMIFARMSDPSITPPDSMRVKNGWPRSHASSARRARSSRRSAKRKG